jgi:hypothetical protein
MKSLLSHLAIPLATAGMLGALLVPTAWAHSDEAATDSLSISRASGTAVVNLTGPGITGTQEAVRCTTVPGSWVSPMTSTYWIGTAANCGDAASGDFTYATTFSLGSDLAPLANLKLEGQVLADDTVTVQLNGNTVFAGGSAGSATSFLTTERSWFTTGTNTLSFVVHNAAAASGLDFTASVTATGAAVTNGPADRDDDDADHGRGHDGDHDGHGTHGACVSAVAHSAHHGPGHGAAVSAAAHDCDH